MKWIIILIIGLSLIGFNYAGAGDLIVDGKVGIGTETPNASLDVRGSAVFNEDGGDYDFRIEGKTDPNLFLVDANPGTVNITGGAPGIFKWMLFRVNGTDVKRAAQYGTTRTFDYDENDFGLALDVVATRSGGVNGLTGMSGVLQITHDSTPPGTVAGGSATSFVFQIGAPSGSGTVNINTVKGFNYALNRRFNIPSSLTYNVNNSYGAYYWVHDGGTSIGGKVNVTNHYANYIADYSNTNGARMVDITNLYGLYIEKLRGGINNYGIVLAGDGAGADIVFGPNKNTSIYSNSGELFAKDGLGNVTQISPHDPETGEWIFYSRNVKTGKVMRVDMERLVKAVEKLTGERFMIETMGKIAE